MRPIHWLTIHTENTAFIHQTSIDNGAQSTQIQTPEKTQRFRISNDINFDTQFTWDFWLFTSFVYFRFDCRRSRQQMKFLLKNNQSTRIREAKRRVLNKIANPMKKNVHFFFFFFRFGFDSLTALFRITTLSFHSFGVVELAWIPSQADIHLDIDMFGIIRLA